MYGYVINRSAAENILRLHTPRLRFEIDTFDFYWKLNTCHLFCIDRQLVGHDDSVLGGSLIAGGEMRHPPARQKNKPLQFQTLYRELSLGERFGVFAAGCKKRFTNRSLTNHSPRPPSVLIIYSIFSSWHWHTGIHRFTKQPIPCAPYAFRCILLHGLPRGTSHPYAQREI